MPRKRTHDEMASSESPAPPPQNDLLHELRNMWEFAALYEWIHLFGPAVKLQPIDIEDLEAECVKPEPSKTLEEIGLTILKFVSSRRDLTLENWDETVRRQYDYKTDGKPHPYGEEEDSVNKFHDFHIFTKIRVLYQLAVWTFYNPDRMRQHFPDYKEVDMFYEWQAHPVGWDRHDRVYYALQGNRLYRRTDPPVSEPVKTKPKYTSKKAQALRKRERASKRRKVAADSDDGDTEMADDEAMDETQVDDEPTAEQTIANADPKALNTFGDYKWECVAMNLDEFNAFIASIAKSKDPNEKNLRSFVEQEMLPELQKARERRERKEAERLRELQMAERIMGAKRSGRLAAKQEKEREEAEAAEVERQRQALLAQARRDEERQHKMENERRSRMMTREQRIKDREYKRILMEEQLARDSEEEKKLEAEGGARGSRQLKERIKKNKEELEQWDGDEWTFDCSGCGQYGKNFDDGEHSIACERCGVWQHSKCLNISQHDAEKDDFHLICADCKRKQEEANRPKMTLKFKVGQSSSPPARSTISPPHPKQESPVTQRREPVGAPPLSRPTLSGTMVNGQFYPTLSSAHPSPPAQIHSAAAVAQPTSPSSAQTQVNRPINYPNGAQPHPYPSYNGYRPPQHFAANPPVQNMYNQVPYHQPPVQHHQPIAPYQHNPHPPSVRPSSSHSSTPRPPAYTLDANGSSSPIRQRIPSPIINRPTISPTQGNPDVGPIAGVPDGSQSLQPSNADTPHTNGHRQPSGAMQQSTPNNPPSRHPSFSASQPRSGLSPTKQRPLQPRSPQLQPSLVPQKERQGDNPYATPSSSFTNENRMRSVSGTPIFPPAENLAPSPQQLKPEPVPTPSKQSPPLYQSSFDSEKQQPQIQRQVLPQEQPSSPQPQPQPPQPQGQQARPETIQ